MPAKGYFRGIALAGVFGLACVTGPAAASLLFSDDFDSDASSTILNFNNLINWTVSNGTVDYIRQGGFSLGCVGGAGGCIDMDGSTNDAGRLVSRASFSVVAGTTYRMTISVSGNQRGGASDSISWGLTDGTIDAPAAGNGGILPSDPYLPRTLTFSGVSGTYRLFVESSGNDNIGPLLDNVVFESLTPDGTVPEPATLLLVGGALLGLVAGRRR